MAHKAIRPRGFQSGYVGEQLAQRSCQERRGFDKTCSRAAAGLPGVRFHDLRHTCVTLLLDLGVPPHVVREIVGHSAIEVTMTIYAHASLEEKRKALGKLGEALS